jgi:hypothetical protein
MGVDWAKVVFNDIEQLPNDIVLEHKMLLIAE